MLREVLVFLLQLFADEKLKTASDGVRVALGVDEGEDNFGGIQAADFVVLELPPAAENLWPVLLDVSEPI
jgi:hypothetical protein